MVRRGRKRGGAVAAEDQPSSQLKKKSKPKKTKRPATEPMDDKEEMNLWNERIRYANALEFLSQQEQLLFPPDSLNELTNAPPFPRRLTRGMCHSLQHFQKTSLTCPLCHTIYAQPVTLSGCAHTFCKSCINDHVDDSWYCPSYVYG
jgi:Zinc finger, C3HC4 type (RING finger)